MKQKCKEAHQNAHAQSYDLKNLHTISFELFISFFNKVIKYETR